MEAEVEGDDRESLLPCTNATVPESFKKLAPRRIAQKDAVFQNLPALTDDGANNTLFEALSQHANALRDLRDGDSAGRARVVKAKAPRATLAAQNAPPSVGGTHSRAAHDTRATSPA